MNEQIKYKPTLQVNKSNNSSKSVKHKTTIWREEGGRIVVLLQGFG